MNKDDLDIHLLFIVSSNSEQTTKQKICQQRANSPPSLTVPQPVTQLSEPLLNTLSLVARHTGLM